MPNWKGVQNEIPNFGGVPHLGTSRRKGVQLMRIVWRETIGHYKFGNSQKPMSMNGFEEILMQFLKLMVIIDTFISMGQSPYRGGYA
jgi:hypothetical protein